VETLEFDAHEFDGLRQAMEQEAEGLVTHVDRFIRENPLLCIGLAAVAGFTLAFALGHKRSEPAPTPGGIDSRRL